MYAPDSSYYYPSGSLPFGTSRLYDPYLSSSSYLTTAPTYATTLGDYPPVKSIPSTLVPPVSSPLPLASTATISAPAATTYYSAPTLPTGWYDRALTPLTGGYYPTSAPYAYPTTYAPYPGYLPVAGPRVISKPTRPSLQPARPRAFPPRPCCTKALLVGVNYRNQGPGKELYGCINDIRCLAQFVEDQGWERDNIVIMDEEQAYDLQPTRNNMIRMLEWLTEDARPGDALFFAFSGHGKQIVDLNGDEADGMDECMITLDGQNIVDDDLFKMLVERLPEGAVLTAITDCCHAGTILDLPYQMQSGQRARGPAPGTPALRNGLVVCFSGCQDAEKSGDMDASAGYAGGACTNSMLSSLSRLGVDCTWGQLLKEMTSHIKSRGMPQVPMISASHPLRSSEPFSLTPRQDYLRPLPRLRSPTDLNPYVNFIRLDQHALAAAPKDGQPRTRGWLDSAIKLGSSALQQPQGGGGGGAGGALAAFGGGAPASAPAQGGGGASIPAEVRMFSGCRDDQTSADVSNVASFGLPPGTGPGGAGGACTNSLMAVLNRGQNIAWVDLLEQMRQILKTKGYTQVPQLSSSRPIDLKSQFQLTQSGGRHRALMVGINYVGQQGQLSGCINDVLTMKQFLQKNGFNDFRVMVDDANVSQEMPTKANIMAGLHWLSEGAKPGDSLFFHYSGHGSHQKDANGDEADGQDETLVPVDYNRAGMIVDDDLLKELVMRCPAGVQLTCLMDCCHSGTILDLPYTFVANQSNTAQALQFGGTTKPNPNFNAAKVFAIGSAIFTAMSGKPLPAQVQAFGKLFN